MKARAMLSGNVFCAHCGGRLVIIQYRDRYIRKDGSEYSVSQIKYACYHKSRRLCKCDGQTTYQADRIDEAVSRIIRKIFRCMDGAPEEEKLQAVFRRQIAGNRAMQKKQGVDMVTPAYNRFKSWAEEFDTASLEQKKMIACQLFDRIEIGRGYKISVRMNITYQQFCCEWDNGNFLRTAADI